MKIAILGASRGLGKCLLGELQKISPESSYFISSRKIALLEKLKGHYSNLQILECDFTGDTSQLFSSLKEFQPTHIICNAGGGVHGKFHEKNWKDHLWTLKLNLIFPMELAHFCLSQLTQLEQLSFVGSAIAESAPDENASSYCTSKHGLRGFVKTLQIENNLDIRLISPPYMETDMLPLGSWPRREGLAKKTEDVAAQIVHQLMDKTQKSTHISF